MSDIEVLARIKMFGGEQIRFRHQAKSCAAPMTCSVYMPPAEHAVPVVYWLSGLTCSDENFVLKAGAQRLASALGIALVAPDTSPRDTGTPGEDQDWDLGTGAGFYVNATQAPWAQHYRMFDYVSAELPAVIAAHFKVTDRAAISGHSMGGHGALVVGLRNPGRYASISAFAPIVNPSDCPWGRKAFGAYLGDDESAWRDYDSCHLLAGVDACPPLLVDQGGADEFLAEQLLTSRLEEVALRHGRPLELRMQPGYDHSYYFIATFIEDHLRFHGAALQPAS